MDSKVLSFVHNILVDVLIVTATISVATITVKLYKTLNTTNDCVKSTCNSFSRYADDASVCTKKFAGNRKSEGEPATLDHIDSLLTKIEEVAGSLKTLTDDIIHTGETQGISFLRTNKLVPVNANKETDVSPKPSSESSQDSKKNDSGINNSSTCSIM